MQGNLSALGRPFPAGPRGASTSVALSVSFPVFALEPLCPDGQGARAAGSATLILRWLVVLAVAVQKGRLHQGQGEEVEESEGPTQKLRQRNQEQLRLCTCKINELLCFKYFLIRK